MISKTKYIVPVIYCFVMLCAAGWSLRKPAYNWDMLPYMGVVLSYDQTDVKSIHQDVYSIAREQVPPLFYNRFVDSSNAYRKSVAQSPGTFYAQFPFYVVKPLYTSAAWLFYKAGVALPIATVWPSAIAYFFTAVLLFAWLKKYWPHVQACIAGMLVMLSPPLITVAGLSSPDAISGLLIFAAIFCLTEKKSLAGIFVLLLLAVFARLDNILPATILLSASLFANQLKRRISPVTRVLLFCMLFGAYFAVSANTHSFGWSILYYPVFAKQLTISYTANTSFNIREYLLLVKSQLLSGLYFSFVSIFFLLVMLLIWNGAAFTFSNLSGEQLVAVLLVAIIVLRFILQPLITDRIYIPYYLAVTAFLVKQNRRQQVLITKSL